MGLRHQLALDEVVGDELLVRWSVLRHPVGENGSPAAQTWQKMDGTVHLIGVRRERGAQIYAKLLRLNSLKKSALGPPDQTFWCKEC